MKKLYQCPDCGSVFLKDTELNECFWQELNCFELSAIEVIADSPTLQAICGYVKIVKKYLCISCNELRNPTLNLN